MAGPGKGTAPWHKTTVESRLTRLVQHLERGPGTEGRPVTPSSQRPSLAPAATVEPRPLPHGLNGDRLEDPTLPPGGHAEAPVGDPVGWDLALEQRLREAYPLVT